MGNTKNIDSKDLLSRYNKGECTEAEKALVESWYLQFNEDDIDISEQRITELGQEIFGALSKDAEVRTKKLWVVRMATAAAVFASLLGAVLWFRPFEEKGSGMVQQAQLKNEAPADKALLKTAEGKTINLTDAANGVLFRDAGMEIVKIGKEKIQYKITGPVRQSGAGVLNTISVPRGQQMEMTLSDDTKVWLNAATTLIFPIVFADLKKRSLSLSGEAYFEVSKDKTHPFVVSTRNQMIEVLGTHFNISAYHEEPSARTSLLEGAVRVSALSKQGEVINSVVLKPNQQAVSTGGNISVQPVEAGNAIGWKNGEFVFRNEPLESILLKASRWYGIEVIYQQQEVGKTLFGGSISRQTPLKTFLNMLEMTGDVHFRVDGKKIIVSK